jgi:hypothetical protein
MDIDEEIFFARNKLAIGILRELDQREWIYHNFPYETVTFLGIPVTVLFFGWIALVVGPYMIFEFAKALCSLKSPRQLLVCVLTTYVTRTHRVLFEYHFYKP